MPCIRTTTSVKLDKEKKTQLRNCLGAAVEKYLGKDPVRMMTIFEDGMDMSRGLEERPGDPIAFIECKFFGGENLSDFKNFDKTIKEEFGRILKMAPPDLYIKYEVINGWENAPKLFKF